VATGTKYGAKGTYHVKNAMPRLGMPLSLQKTGKPVRSLVIRFSCFI